MPQGRVLIVDADASARSTLAVYFQTRRWTAVATSSLAGGVILLGSSPDCIVLDPGLADGDGLEILREIEGRNLPVCAVIVAGPGDSRRLDEAAPFRPYASFLKPVPPSLIFRACEMAWAERHLGRP